MDALLRKAQWDEWRLQLLEHLRTPLYRNGYALIASSLLTSGIGFFYWVIGAKSYPDAVFGIDTTLINVMTFLSSVSMLNMGNMLIRFIPTASKKTPRLVLTSYAISVAVAAVASLIFLVGLPVFAPTLGVVNADPRYALWFVASTMLWCIFVLQDSTLTGLRQAVWVPLENLVFALAKVGLLVALASTAPSNGIFLSWTIPVIVVVPLINALIFGRLMPRHVREFTGEEAPLSFGRSARFAGSDFAGSMIMLAVNNLLSVVVLERLGAAAAAYFNVAFTIAYTLYLFTSNIGTSLIAESAADPSRLNVYTYRALLQVLRLMIPLVLVIELGAPLLLQLFGKTYSTESTTLLRLLCLSAVPNAINALFIAIQRARLRMRVLVIMMSCLASLIVGLTFLLMGPMGITGVGLAWLIAQTVVATVLLLTEMRPLWLGRINLWSLVELRQKISDSLLRRPHNIRAEVDAQLPRVLGEISLQSGLKEPTGWQLLDGLGVDWASTAYHLGTPGHPQAVLKLADTPPKQASLEQHRVIVEKLRANSKLGGFWPLVPQVLAHGHLNSHMYIAETLLPGVNGVDALNHGLTDDTLLRAAAAAIRPLHQKTARAVAVDAALLASWVDQPSAIVRKALARSTSQAVQALDRITAELHDTLAGRHLTAGWIHGDYVPGNVIVDPSSGAITGIVDWELALENALPHIDLTWLILATRIHGQRQELGNVIFDLLHKKSGGWTDVEQEVLAPAADDQAVPPLRSLVLLTWLYHVSCNLGKEAERYTGNWLWLSKNVESVLFYL